MKKWLLKSHLTKPYGVDKAGQRLEGEKFCDLRSSRVYYHGAKVRSFVIRLGIRDVDLNKRG
ncbi:MAG: hypothetical protein ACJ8G3_21795 [Burkholderiaceae bacterium]